MTELCLLQMLRDDAHHLATGGQRRIRDCAHQADAAATIDQANAMLP